MKNFDLKQQNILALLAPGAILALTFVAYFQAVQGGFIWDDDYYVTNNPALRDFSGLWKIWFNPGSTPQYYPLVFTLFWVEYHLWGLAPAGFHITNVCVHAVNSVLIFSLLKRLDVKWAFLSAVIFALHPVHLESAAWITELKNVLSGFFYLTSLYFFLEYYESERVCGKSKLLKYTVSLLLYFFSLLSKTVTCSLPVAIILVIWWKKRVQPKKLFPALIPFFVLGAGMGLFTVWMEKNNVGADGPEFAFTLLERSLIAGRAIFFYIYKILFPFNISFNYTRWQIDSSVAWQYVFPFAAVIGILLLWMARKLIGRGPVTATLFFVTTLFPALGFVNVYPMRYSFVADHFQYLASIGVIVLFPAVLNSAANAAGSRWAAFTVKSLIPLFLLVLTFTGSQKYRSREELWRDTLKKNDQSFMAHNNLGLILQERGEREEARVHFLKSIKAYPGDIGGYNNLALLYTGDGRYGEARALFEKALALRPESARILNNFGFLFESTGDSSKAVKYYGRALKAWPGYLEALVNMANVLTKRGAYNESNRFFLKALNISPNDADTHFNFGISLNMQKKNKEAMIHFQKALELNPSDAEAWYWMAVIMESDRRFHKALEYFKRAIQLDPGYAKARKRAEALLQKVTRGQI